MCIYYPHLIDEETDARAGTVTFPQSHLGLCWAYTEGRHKT